MDKDTPKTMAEKYDEKMRNNKESKNKSLKDKFKELSGFAQQYLFYYARELGIGR